MVNTLMATLRGHDTQIQYLGHIISEMGIVVDPKNIKAIEDWPIPTSVTEIRSFLGLAEYYQNFIENFSRIACPMFACKRRQISSYGQPSARKVFKSLSSF